MVVINVSFQSILDVTTGMEIDSNKKMPSNPDNCDEAKEWPYEVLKRFRLIFKAVQQHSQWVETCCGVTSAQLWAMSELAGRPGLRVSDLAKAMCIHQSTASNLLEKLARKGYIKRERVSQDQRVVTVYLTESGTELLDRAPLTPRGILQHALFHLPADTLAPLAKHLDVLIDEMEIKDEQAATQPLVPLARTVQGKNTG